MAFETLRVRVASATLLAPLFLAVVYTGGLWLAGLLALLAVVCICEFTGMARAAAFAPNRTLGVLGALAVFAGAYLHGFLGAAMAVTLFPLLLLLPYLAAVDFSRATVDTGLTLFGVFHYAYFFSFVYLIRTERGQEFPSILCLLLLVWVQDSAAYLVGSICGRRPLTPISPKKTWEGTLAGLVLAVAVTAAVWQYGFDRPVRMVTVALLGVIGVLAQLGDLSESLLKRNFGAKDSGQTIPGHGGLLDRFDSLCYSAPAMYLLHPWM